MAPFGLCEPSFLLVFILLIEHQVLVRSIAGYDKDIMAGIRTRTRILHCLVFQ